MKIFDGLQFRPENEVMKCPQCSSVSLDSSSQINVPEWKPGQATIEKTEFSTTYTCLTCGYQFSNKDIENRSVFKEGMMTLFFIFIMIVLLLIVLL